MSLSQAAGRSAEEVRQALDEVFADPRFDQATEERDWFARLLHWLWEYFDLAPSPRGIEFLGYVIWGGLGLLVLALLVALLRQSRASGRKRALLTERSGPVRREHEFREVFERARAARASGAGVRALRLYLFALVLAQAERKLVRFDPAWTLREILTRGALQAQAAKALRELVEALEPAEYEQRPVGEAELADLDARCLAWLQSARGALP